jgi:hypothetical protein
LLEFDALYIDVREFTAENSLVDKGEPSIAILNESSQPAEVSIRIPDYPSAFHPFCSILSAEIGGRYSALSDNSIPWTGITNLRRIKRRRKGKNNNGKGTWKAFVLLG